MQSSDTLAVEFEFTPEDWSRANATHSWNSQLTKQALKQMQMLYATIVGLMALLLLLAGTSLLGAVTMGLVGMALIGVLKPLVRYSQKRQIERVADLGLINGIFGPHRVELRDDGILNSTSGYEWLVRWNAIEDIQESDGAFLIYSGANSFLTIPSSAFPDAETLRAFGDRFFQHFSRVEHQLPAGGEGHGEP